MDGINTAADRYLAAGLGRDAERRELSTVRAPDAILTITTVEPYEGKGASLWTK
jgi:hypothetical protein